MKQLNVFLLIRNSFLLTGLLWLICFPAISIAELSQLTLNTKCNTPESNLKFGVYRKLYDIPLKLQMDLLFSYINEIDDETEFRNNVLGVAGNIVSLTSAIGIDNSVELVIGAIGATGEIVKISGTNDYLPIVIDGISAAIAVYANPSPLAIADYLILNSLSIINQLSAFVKINNLRKQYEIVSSTRQILDLYYYYCGNQKDILSLLEIIDVYNECSGSFLTCATVQYSKKNGWYTDENITSNTIQETLSGVNHTETQISNLILSSPAPLIASVNRVHTKLMLPP